MTAEIFLASTLGCLTATIVTCVFFKTVYMPVLRHLRRRAWSRSGGQIGDSVNIGDFVSVGSAEVSSSACHAVPGVLDKTAFESHQRQFEAQQSLCLAALDVTDDFQDQRPKVERVLTAAQAFRRATTPRVRKQMRAMEAFRKAQHEPDDPV